MRKNYSLIVLFTFILLLSGCAKPTPAEMSRWDYGPYPADHEQTVKDAMITYLIDPYSAQYHFQGAPTKAYKMKPFSNPEYGWGGKVVINAKNKLGGYTGAKVFFYIIRNNNLVLFEEHYGQ